MKKINTQTFPFYLQSTAWNCGFTCLKMIASYYNKEHDLQQIEKYFNTMSDFSTMLDIVECAEKLGMSAVAMQIQVNQLKHIIPPAILHWDEEHFVVLLKIVNRKYVIADPAIGISQFNSIDFLSHWAGKQHMGIVLVLSS